MRRAKDGNKNRQVEIDEANWVRKDEEMGGGRERKSCCRLLFSIELVGRWALIEEGVRKRVLCSFFLMRIEEEDRNECK